MNLHKNDSDLSVWELGLFLDLSERKSFDYLQLEWQEYFLLFG